MSDELSSDILERQFGPTRLEVLYQDGGTRVIRTTSAGGQVLELSWVSFRGGAGDSALAQLNKQVAAGKSMGKAFRDLGVDFTRVTHGTYACAPAGGLSDRFKASGPVTVVDVSILAGPSKTPYADILEVYAPSVAWPAAAQQPGDMIDAKLRNFEELLTDIKA